MIEAMRNESDHITLYRTTVQKLTSTHEMMTSFKAWKNNEFTIFISVNSFYYFDNCMMKLMQEGDELFLTGHELGVNVRMNEFGKTAVSMYMDTNEYYTHMKFAPTNEVYKHVSNTIISYDVIDA